MLLKNFRPAPRLVTRTSEVNRPRIFLRLLVIGATLAVSACGHAAPPATASPVVAWEIPSPTLTPLDTTTLTPTLASTPQPSATPPNWWQPAPGLTWQWQIGDDDINLSLAADVYDVDLYVDQTILDALHSQGARVICYISAGSWENWRPDAGLFPREVLGQTMDGWPDERWLDIRQIDKLAPILRARLDLCQEKGFDGLEPDNLEVVENGTGFPLLAADETRFALWLAEEAHARGLAIGQKNAPHQTPALVGVYDFAITEDCFAYGWCEQMQPYLATGKPVLAAEYTDMEINFVSACKLAADLNLSMILKERDLTAWRATCP